MPIIAFCANHYLIISFSSWYILTFERLELTIFVLENVIYKNRIVYRVFKFGILRRNITNETSSTI